MQPQQRYVCTYGQLRRTKAELQAVNEHVESLEHKAVGRADSANPMEIIDLKNEVMPHECDAWLSSKSEVLLVAIGDGAQQHYRLDAT